MPAPRDLPTLTLPANLVMGARPNLVSVRIWDRSGGEFVERVAATGSAPIEEMSDDTTEALRSGLASKVVSTRPYGTDKSLYRIFVPITTEGRLSGAVEVVERFDSIWSVALRYARKTVWMSLVAILLIILGTIFFFASLFTNPLVICQERCQRQKRATWTHMFPRAAQTNRINVEQFNGMIRQVREMTKRRGTTGNSSTACS